MKFHAVALLTLFLAGCQMPQTDTSAKAEKETRIENLCNEPAVNPQPAFETPVLSAPQIEALMVEPTNVEQLLANIKLAADRDLLVQNAFFDDAVLRKFFGAAVVHSEETSPRRVYPTSVFGPVREVLVSGSGDALAGITVELRSFTNCIASFAALAHPPPAAFQPPRRYVTSFALVHTAALEDLNVGIARRVFGFNPIESEGFCKYEGSARYCSADSLLYSDIEKLGKYPIPFWKHEVEFTPLRSPKQSPDRRTVHFDDDNSIALITIYQGE